MPIESPAYAASRARVFDRSVDGRTKSARHFLEVLGAIEEEAGGRSTLSRSSLMQCRRAATLTIECEKMETRAAQGEAIDSGHYATLVNSLNRTMALLSTRHTFGDGR
jgi:hypothetical protein